MSLTYVTLDLCVHSEYVEILRKELDSPAYTTFLETSQGLPLLDSFIKESARVTPFEVGRFFRGQLPHAPTDPKYSIFSASSTQRSGTFRRDSNQ